jgi:NAD(P)-dependent dehydrogenase (short-subunit alcohol dehydrogenase family)
MPHDHLDRVIVVVDGLTAAGQSAVIPTAEIAPAVTRRLVAEGARVWWISLRADARERGLAAGAIGVTTCPAGDLTGAVAEVKEAVGLIDAVFVNAALDGAAVTFAELSPGSLRSLGDALATVTLLVQQAAKAVVDGGSLCVATSVHGTVPAARTAEASMLTGALTALVKSMAPELADRHVCVTALCPGRRAEHDHAGLWDEHSDDSTPDRVLADVASLGAFLLGSDAAFCTGGIFTMDGTRSF